MKSFDLRLCPWGPYNKTYLGVSNVADKEKGISFDLNLFPGFYRRSVLAPKDICDNGAKILKASADLSHFLIRYELMWKDLVYIDADYRADEDGNMFISINAVNNTDENQSLSLSSVASLKFPTFLRKTLKVLEYRGDGDWLDACDYSRIDCKEKINNEGYKNGARRLSSFVGASGIYLGTFDESSVAEYKMKNSVSSLFVRYTADEDVSAELEINGKSYSLHLPKTDSPSLIKVDCSETFDGFKLRSKGGEGYIDGFVSGGTKHEFYDYTRDFIPEITKADKAVRLKYKYASYEISWDYDDYLIRELIGSDPGAILTDSVHNFLSDRLIGHGEGHGVDILIYPIFLKPGERKSFCIKIKRLDKNTGYPVNNEFASIPVNSDGEKYKLSMDIMSAVTLTNVAFPIYIKDEYIRHSTPGRLFDCLYTWDSGFIGMGLGTLDSIRAEDCLSNYMTDPEDPAPFIMRGSVVPTQIFLLREIWNSGTNIELLRKYYPQMLRYYNFFIEIMDKDTNLIKTWDYFYNSGGWDDYPAQKYVHDNKLTHKIFPVVTASITILFAKMMKDFAKLLSLGTESFDNEIKRLTSGIEKLWDEETGYFGYYDKEEKDILKYGDINFNMGFDGIYPYIAGITTKTQDERILDNINNGLMTRYGISVVDLRAPYLSHKGYWNGSVWMPHQWVLWKAALDKGQPELCDKIAFTAMDLWKKEVGLTYNCYEHFMLSNGRGAGFHQFSGLSTPVLLWYKAYFSPGTLNVGFCTFVNNIKWEENFDGASFEIVSCEENSDILVCLDEKQEYDLYVNDSKAEYEKVTSGCIRAKARRGKYVLCKIK